MPIEFLGYDNFANPSDAPTGPTNEQIDKVVKINQNISI